MSEPTVVDRLVAIQNSLNQIYSLLYTVGQNTTGVSTAALASTLNDMKAELEAAATSEEASLASIDGKLSETPSE